MRRVKFTERFPEAFPCQEVLDLLYRSADEAPCGCCGDLTPFLDYTFHPRAVPICSEECLLALAERKAGQPLGKVADYRPIEEKR